MNFHILTLFPEMIEQGLMNSITGRAVKEQKITIEAVNIRDFSRDKHRSVDDYTYGGGAGMLMQAQPVYDAWCHVQEGVCGRTADGVRQDGSKPGASARRVRTIYVTPQGRCFNQKMAEDFAKEEDLVILCGHYEGIDERVLEETVTDYVSIGDYILTGGELAAMVMVDAIARLVPGVLGNETSSETESFHGSLLEYPQYSRPEVWHDKEVPKVLLSGNQKQIAVWRLAQSVMRTKERRPDLYRIYEELSDCIPIMMKEKFLHMDMIECIRRGRAKLIFRDGGEILLREEKSGIYMHTDPSETGNAFSAISEEEAGSITCLVMHQAALVDKAEKSLHLTAGPACRQAVCTRKEKLPVSGLYRPDGKPMPNGLVIKRLTKEYAAEAAEAYIAYGYLAGKTLPDEKREAVSTDVAGRIAAGEMFGAFFVRDDGTEQFAGFIGKHAEGSLGMLTVFPEYRRQKIGLALETFLINREIELGMTPYGHILETNEASFSLSDKLGGYLSKTPLFWLEKKRG